MFDLNFTNDYEVVHLANELGKRLIGGAGTYMNQIYRYRNDRTGFVYVNLGEPEEDVRAADFLEEKDILVLNSDEMYKLSKLRCKVIVVQFYEFAPLLTEDIIKDKKIVYVIHSVPIPEPPPEDDPFGGNDDVREKFERLCDLSSLLICVSYAEQDRLIKMYPQYKDKIKVIHNGITINENADINYNYQKSRKVFGYIGRTDYRKGIIECLEEIKNLDVIIKIACPKNDSDYIAQILAYIEKEQISDKVEFCGWCVGKRKESFFASIDALVIPSLYEPFGYIALEAMERGLMVVSSNNGGLAEILSDYKYTYNPYEKGQLEKMLQQFINEDSKILEQQQCILLSNVKKFTAQKMAMLYMISMEELINGNKI